LIIIVAARARLSLRGDRCARGGPDYPSGDRASSLARRSTPDDRAGCAAQKSAAESILRLGVLQRHGKSDERQNGRKCPMHPAPSCPESPGYKGYDQIMIESRWGCAPRQRQQMGKV
jgi:hypothetical protein